MSTSGSDEYQRQVAEIVEQRLENFSTWARNLLAANRGEAAAFEARLWVRWQDAFDLFELVFVETQTLGAEFNNQHRPQAAADNDAVFDALVTLHARASLLASEVYALLRTGHPVGAIARWRSLHEVLVIAQLIRASDAELAERYILHDVVQRWRAAKKYQQYADVLGEELLEQSFVDQVDQAVQKLRGKFGPSYSERYGWASALVGKKKPTLENLEERANLDFMRPYYSLASEGIHPEVKGMRRSVYTMGEDVLLAGPTNYGLADAGQWTLWALYYCTAALVSLKPTASTDASLLLLSQLVSKASEAFVRTDKEIHQDEDQLRGAKQQASGDTP